MKGLFGRQTLVADTEVSVGLVSANAAYAEVDINILNPTANDATISVAISSEAVTPNAGDYIEQGLVLTGDGSVLVRSKEILSAGERVFVKSSVSGVLVRVSGVEHV